MWRCARQRWAGGGVAVEFTGLGSACGLFFAAPDEAAAVSCGKNALLWLARLESRWSRYLPDSQLRLINAKAGGDWTKTDPELEVILDLCAYYHFSTQGIFDATSLPLSRLWDWRQPEPQVPSPQAEAAARKGLGQIIVRPGIQSIHPFCQVTPG